MDAAHEVVAPFLPAGFLFLLHIHPRAVDAIDLLYELIDLFSRDRRDVRLAHKFLLC
jgi:hypothetical protein